MTVRNIDLFIDGEWRAAADRLAVLNPATEEQVAAVAVAQPKDLDDALAAAERGFRLWRRTAPAERAAVLRRAAQLMRQRQEVIAQAITEENGKPLHEARAEVIRGCEFLEWDAGEALRLYGHIVPSAPGIRYMVLREPIGPVAAFSPWNFPMSQPARKIAGAIAAGCSVIIKASEETPTGVIFIAQALQEAGLPAGVLNLVFGVPATISGHLIPSPTVRAIAFTGSTAVGKHLTEIAARHMKPALMELGGHAPVIICDDVEAEQVAKLCAQRKFRNSGQVCTSPTRFFVAEKLYPKFAETFATYARNLVVGDGQEAGTQMGPVANDRRITALEALVRDARDRGGKVLAGGSRQNRKGYFFSPTVLAELPQDARALNEEPFGPLAIINPVKDLDEALHHANALPFGLAAYAFTNRSDYADHLMQQIEAGNFSINTLEASVAEVPFGGVKDSGLGREGGAEGLHHYTVVKTISHRTAP